MGVVYSKTIRSYRADFKNRIIEKIIKFVSKDLTYLKDSRIPLGTFKSSMLFQRKPDIYTGDDYVKGRIGSTNIEFSEIHAQYETHDKNGRHRHTLFKGIFFAADFNKNFKGYTIVLPDTAQKLLGGLGQALQKMAGIIRPGELIKLEDPEFERYFVVYGSDQVEARYILSTSLMQRILDFRKKTAKIIRLSFVGTKIYAAVSYKKNLFEPTVLKSLVDFDLIKGYLDDLDLAVGIVEDLNLNTRIWSKS
jgi:hypothetical protein